MAAYDNAALVASIKRRALIPTAQGTFTTSDILAAATEVLQGPLAEVLLSLSEEYWVATSDTSLVASTSAYRIPSRAMAMALRDLHLVLGSGATQQLTRIPPERVASYGSTTTGQPQSFYFTGNSHVTVWPTPTAAEASQSQKLRFTYRRRPSALVDSAGARVAAVTAVNSTTGQVTVSALPSGMTTSTPLDVVRGTAGFDVLVASALPASTNATSATFGAGVVPSETVVGDYLCFAEEAPFAQVVPEAHQLLAQMTAAYLLEALGDSEGLAAAQAKAEALKATLKAQASSRIDGEAMALVSEDWT